MTDSPRLMGRKEAAEYCGIAPGTFSLWVATHKMPPAVPGTRKWDKRAIDAKLDEISGLATADQEDPYEKWMRENRDGGGSEGRDSLREWREKKEKRRAKYQPQMGLDVKLQRVLIYMANHPECETIGEIPQAGPTSIQWLIDKGAVRAGTHDADGMTRYSLTAEGKAEAERIVKWWQHAP